MPTLLLVGFLLYLYVPFLLFLFFAELSIDIGPDPDSNQVRDFFSGALPSAALNIASWLFLTLADLLTGALYDKPNVDWNVIASVLSSQPAALMNAIRGGFAHELRYLWTLYVISACFGYVYGKIELHLYRRRAETDWFLRSLPQLRQGQWFVALLFRQFWEQFLLQRKIWLFGWIAVPTFVYVRTRDDRLFSGRLVAYDKQRSGAIDAIMLDDAERFSREPVEECLSKGKNPLRKLHGTVLIRWSDVTDINVVPEEVMHGLRQKYAARLHKYHRERRLRPDGQDQEFTDETRSPLSERTTPP